MGDQRPFNQLLNKQWTLQRDVKLARNLSQFVYEQPLFIAEEETLFEGVESLAVISKGAPVTFHSATLFNNGVSGVTICNLTGTVFVEEFNKEIQFEYQWGNFHVICLEEPCMYWTFPQGFWQKEADNRRYFLE